MNVVINGEKYEVVIERKNNKHTYLRVKNDMKIHITTNYLTPKPFIEKFIKDNADEIEKMISRIEKRIEKKEQFYFLGKKYDIVLCNIVKVPQIIDDKIYAKDLNSLNNYVKKTMKKLFQERLDYNYEKFNGIIPYPKLVIRKMIRKWGHCNKREEIVTLNSDLIKYEIDDLDYVIVHELCHLIEFNHSPEFWKQVKKYKPDYLINKKHLREE